MSGTRPAKRRQTNEAGTSQGFDQRRFISQEIESYHNERLLSRTMVRERGIQEIDDIAQKRHWEDFLNDPRVANKTLVREFYANLRFTDQQRHTVMVRGKNINFSARTFNSLFGTPSIDTPRKVQEFLEDHPPLDTICELICRDNPQWTLSRLNEPIHFSRTKLTLAADNWLRFVSAQLLPSSHTSEVTREHAVMIFAILIDIPFDIGRFLHRSILKNAMGGLTVGLYHPSLITELCACDELLQPDSMIRANHLSPRQQWWILWADQMHIPMSNRPHYPPNEPAEPPPADMEDE
ncbi:hypothetical protein CDL12_09713 [Handroanthus impetiginosus]|uniref:Putative plant transposon protein domain-containing protein n=1 Tax=Handroanthus impetiginosus TaxID=429701 RepID=A0A2G9HJC2_9LAMI|nr:hypothetical protein CDL12_09713 [Handroanthus impetiginosus]